VNFFESSKKEEEERKKKDRGQRGNREGRSSIPLREDYASDFFHKKVMIKMRGLLSGMHISEGGFQRREKEEEKKEKRRKESFLEKKSRE